MNKVIIIFLLFIFGSFVECKVMKQGEFCYRKNEFECFGNFSYNCGNAVCTKTQYNCHVLSLFSKQKVNELKYTIFMGKIKDCLAPPKYKWNKKDVCLNSKTCTQSGIFRLWSIKLNECKCPGKHSFKCNNKDYCGIDERACEGLKKTSTIGKIEKC